MAMIVQATHEHSMTHSRSKSVDLYSILHGRVEKHENMSPLYTTSVRAMGTNHRSASFRIDML